MNDQEIVDSIIESSVVELVDDMVGTIEDGNLWTGYILNEGELKGILAQIPSQMEHIGRPKYKMEIGRSRKHKDDYLYRIRVWV